MNLYKECRLCPRMCRTDRSGGETGFCGETEEIRMAAAVMHFGEEPPISRQSGSGTLFFSGCTLKCSFCQNRQISAEGIGSAVTPDELVRLFLRFQEEGAESINLVTGTHFIPGIAAALDRAKFEGLTLPVVWNSSGFEYSEALSVIDPYIDIYLPDLKTVSSDVGVRVYGRDDYAERAREAVLWMIGRRQLLTDGEELVGGVIVRHLVLPGMVENTRDVLKWYAENCIDSEKGRPSALLSLMFQFTPPGGPVLEEAVPGKGPLPVENRRVSEKEYEEVCGWLEMYGIEEGFIQELEEGDGWYPDFRNRNPFPDPKARTVWHWRDGFGA